MVSHLRPPGNSRRCPEKSGNGPNFLPAGPAAHRRAGSDQPFRSLRRISGAQGNRRGPAFRCTSTELSAELIPLFQNCLRVLRADLAEQRCATSVVGSASRARLLSPSPGARCPVAILAYFPITCYQGVWKDSTRALRLSPASAAVSRSSGGRPQSMTKTVRRGPDRVQAGGTVLYSLAPAPRPRCGPKNQTNPRRRAQTTAWLACHGLDRRRAEARFDNADQPRRRQGRGARVLAARCRPLEQAPSRVYCCALAPQPRMRSRRSRSLRTRQLPPPDSTLRCQSSSRVMYSRGSTLSERSLVTLIAITSKPSTVSGRSRT